MRRRAPRGDDARARGGGDASASGSSGEESEASQPLSPSPYEGLGRGDDRGARTTDLVPELQGARFVATVAVLYHHDWYFSGGARSWAGRNGLAAVDFFVVLSGFATHWSCARRPFRLGAWGPWCVRRTRKAVAAAWATMALDAAVFCALERPVRADAYWYGGGGPVGLWRWFGGGGALRGARCAAFVNWWWEPHTLCPNNAAWTVGALLPCWCLVYAPARALANRASPRTLLAAAVLLAVLPVVLMLPAELARSGLLEREIGTLEDAAQYAMYCGLSGISFESPIRDRACFPLSVALNFIVGVLAAALAVAARSRPPRRVYGRIADGAALFVVAAVVLLPSDSARRRVATHALVPFHAAFLVATAGDAGGGGVAARILRSKWLVHAGSYASLVYLAEFPLARLWTNLFGSTADVFSPERYPPKTAAFLLALALTSVVYVDCVQPRLFRSRARV